MKATTGWTKNRKRTQKNTHDIPKFQESLKQVTFWMLRAIRRGWAKSVFQAGCEDAALLRRASEKTKKKKDSLDKQTNEKLLVEGNAEILARFVQIYPFDSSSRGLNDFSIWIWNKRKNEKGSIVRLLMFHQLLFSLLNEKNARRAAHVINPQLHFLFLSLFIFLQATEAAVSWASTVQCAGKIRTDPGSVFYQRCNFGETNAWLKLQSKRIRANATH